MRATEELDRRGAAVGELDGLIEMEGGEIGHFEGRNWPCPWRAVRKGSCWKVGERENDNETDQFTFSLMFLYFGDDAPRKLSYLSVSGCQDE